MPEELAFQEVLRNGRAVHRDEGGFPARAAGVDGPGDQFLARPGLAGDEDGGFGVGHLAHHGEDPLHGAGGPHDAVELGAPGKLLLQQAVLLGEPLELEPLEHGDLQFFAVERLGEVVEGPELHRLHRGIYGAEGGEHDDDRRRRPLLDRREHLETGHARHLQVGDHQLGRLLLEKPQAGLAVRSGVDVVPLLLQVVLENAPQRTIVVDDEDLRGHGIPDEGDGMLIKRQRQFVTDLPGQGNPFYNESPPANLLISATGRQGLEESSAAGWCGRRKQGRASFQAGKRKKEAEHHLSVAQGKGA